MPVAVCLANHLWVASERVVIYSDGTAGISTLNIAWETINHMRCSIVDKYYRSSFCRQIGLATFIGVFEIASGNSAYISDRLAAILNWKD